jgi:hypothetical protein
LEIELALLSKKSERNEKVEFLLTKARKYATERAMPGKLKSLNLGSAPADDMLKWPEVKRHLKL